MIDYNYELELYIILIITQFKNYRLEDHPHSVDRTPTQGSKSPHNLDFRTFVERYFSIL